MAKRVSFKEFEKQLMKDPKTVAAYEALRPEFELARDFIRARIKARYSQRDLAKKLNLQQPAIARLESGGYVRTSVAKLSKVADALGYKFKFYLEPKKGR